MGVGVTEIKKCVDCKWCFQVLDPGYVSKSGLYDAPVADKFYCVHPVHVDFVTGRDKSVICETARNLTGKCAEEGRLFEKGEEGQADRYEKQYIYAVMALNKEREELSDELEEKAQKALDEVRRSDVSYANPAVDGYTARPWWRFW